MSTHPAATRLLAIAKRDVGQVEVTRNRAPWIAKYWPTTSYPEGHTNREPYCAAAVCYWLATVGRELAEDGLFRTSFGMTLKQFEVWRCKSARAFDWRDWARKQNLIVLPETATAKPGDIIIFDFSHIGLIEADLGKAGFATIEANTNASGSRDGDGCWNKTRARNLAQCLIRLPFNNLP
jgi:hypothetical protein